MSKSISWALMGYAPRVLSFWVVNFRFAPCSACVLVVVVWSRDASEPQIFYFTPHPIAWVDDFQTFRPMSAAAPGSAPSSSPMAMQVNMHMGAPMNVQAHQVPMPVPPAGTTSGVPVPPMPHFPIPASAAPLVTCEQVYTG
jgi:hypothetical protein